MRLPHPFPWAKWDARLRGLKAEGKNATQIAGFLWSESGVEVSPEAVRSRLSKHHADLITAKDGWTDDRVELLKKLWADGLSASEIAAELGIASRNSVIGKVHRLNLAGRAKDMSASKAPRQRKPKNADPRTAGMVQRINAMSNIPLPMKPVESLPVPENDTAIPEGQRKTIATLPLSGACKWPVGEPSAADFFFCGGVTSMRPWGPMGDSRCPYCDWHAGRAIGRRTPSERNAAA